MTLGDLIEELELLAKHYALNTKVTTGGYDRAANTCYYGIESVEYSPANDLIVVW